MLSFLPGPCQFAGPGQLRGTDLSVGGLTEWGSRWSVHNFLILILLVVGDGRDVPSWH